MLFLYILIGIICFIALCTAFNRYYIIMLPRKRDKLYLVIEGEIPHIEAIMRGLYTYLGHKACFEPLILDNSSGDSKLILEKFCQSYNLTYAKDLPKSGAKTIYIDKNSSAKELKKEIYLLRTEIELQKKATGF